MAIIVVALTLRTTWAHRQDGLGTLQSLSLTLFIDAKHDGFLGWIEIEPHDITHLFDKHRIAAEFKTLYQVWLQTKGLPDASHRMLINICFPGHEPTTPLSSSRRWRFQGFCDHFFNLLIRDFTRRSTAWRVHKPCHPFSAKTSTPLANGVYTKF